MVLCSYEPAKWRRLENSKGRGHKTEGNWMPERSFGGELSNLPKMQYIHFIMFHYWNIGVVPAVSLLLLTLTKGRSISEVFQAWVFVSCLNSGQIRTNVRPWVFNGRMLECRSIIQGTWQWNFAFRGEAVDMSVMWQQRQD